MGKREPQIILQDRQAPGGARTRPRANSPQNQRAGTKNRVFLEGDRLEIEVKGGRWVLTHQPPSRRRRSPSCTTGPGCVERGRYEHHCQWDVGFGDRGVPI